MKFLFMGLLLSTSLWATTKDICGKTDDRQLSFRPEVGRILESLSATHGCTLTMIGKSCALSAGHCYPIMNYVEFNTPSSANGQIVHSQTADIYKIDKTSVVWSKGFGNDYAVFKILPNEQTGRLAGDVQGFLPINFDKIRRGTMLKMYGYGASNDPQGNNAQQESRGKLKKIKANGLMYHRLDAANGSSGSAILLDSSDEIIGIHTHNGCQELLLKGNRATAIATNKQLVQAIKNCLISEQGE